MLPAKKAENMTVSISYYTLTTKQVNEGEKYSPYVIWSIFI
jgi:hypothetical protein